MIDMLKLRRAIKARKPWFLRQDYHKKKRLALVWRRPKGVDSKLRKRKKGQGAWVQPGYGSPASVRGFDRSGHAPVLVSDVAVVQRLDPGKQSIIIAAGVGLKKRHAIAHAAAQRKVTVVNVRSVDELHKRIADEMGARKERRKTSSP